MYNFTDDCLLGIAQLDEDHRHLFELINSAAELLHNEVVTDKYYRLESIIDELKTYADTHFEHEEGYMEQINDPELDMQRKQHAVFCQKIDELDVRGKDDLDEQHETLEEMLVYLTKWLYRHILSSDTMIGKLEAIEKEEDPCEFTEKYFTGINIIDKEHRELFRIMGEARDLIKDDFIPDKYDNIVVILDELKEYTQIHFKDEEGYMESINYPKIDVQKRAHEAFIEKLNEISMEDVDENQQEYLLEIMDFLIGWLINHVLKVDKQIGQNK